MTKFIRNHRNGFATGAFLVALAFVLVGAVFATQGAFAAEKFDVCHKTGPNWNYLDTPDQAAYDGHIGHGDFDYDGPIDEQGKGSDAWCTENVPTPDPETGTLTLEKVVVGEASDTDWTLEFSGADFGSGVEGDGVITNVEVEVGKYDLSEGGGPDGYTPSDWVCEGAATQDDSDTVTIATDEDVTCTITNTQDPVDPDTGTLTIYKEVNDVSGESVTFDFTVDADDDDFDGVFDLLGGEDQSRDDILPGEYTFTESEEDGWTLGEIICEAEGNSSFDIGADNVIITFEEGDDVSCTFFNDIVDPDLGSIYGKKWNDEDGDGEFDDNEIGISGWTIVLSGDGNATTTTDEFGDYSFENVEDGSYEVCEVQQEGWSQTYPTEPLCHAVDVEEGSDSTENNFGNQEEPEPVTGEIHGAKWNDENEDGEWVEELGLSGWTIWAYGPDQFATSTVTNGDGEYWFTDLLPGTYDVCEDEQIGWTQTYPNTVETGFVDCDGTIGYEVLLSDATTTVRENADFGNHEDDVEKYLIDGYVWEDTNENGVFDEDESGISGWPVSINDGEVGDDTTTGEGGYYSFMVIAGTWTVSADLQTDWRLTSPSDDGFYIVTVPTEEPEVALGFPHNIFSKFMNVAHAQASISFGPFNFGFFFTGGGSGGGGGSTSGGGGGGGGGSISGGGIPQPQGEVLGAQTEILPAGAPNTGAGGMSGFWALLNFFRF